jgi:hypothetical protein
LSKFQIEHAFQKTAAVDIIFGRWISTNITKNDTQSILLKDVRI